MRKWPQRNKCRQDVVVNTFFGVFIEELEVAVRALGGPRQQQRKKRELERKKRFWVGHSPPTRGNKSPVPDLKSFTNLIHFFSLSLSLSFILLCFFLSLFLQIEWIQHPFSAMARTNANRSSIPPTIPFQNTLAAFSALVISRMILLLLHYPPDLFIVTVTLTVSPLFGS